METGTVGISNSKKKKKKNPVRRKLKEELPSNTHITLNEFWSGCVIWSGCDFLGDSPRIPVGENKGRRQKSGLHLKVLDWYFPVV